jgi:hypothetical protein
MVKLILIKKEIVFLLFLTFFNGTLLCVHKHFKNLSDIFGHIAYDMLIIHDFNRFGDLSSEDLNCSKTNETNVIINQVYFVPSKPLIIDETINLVPLMYRKRTPMYMFTKVKGFNIGASLLVGQDLNSLKNLNLAFVFSSLNAYIFTQNKPRLLDESECKVEIYNHTKNVFYEFVSISFSNTIYPTKICPIIFKNSLARQINFHDLINTLLVQNQFSFTSVKSFASNICMENLLIATFDVYYVNLTLGLLNKHLFAYVREIKINHVLEDIEQDLFGMGNFYYLKFIDLNLENFGEFFHRSGNKWMRSLNNYLNVSRVNEENHMMIRFKFASNHLSFSRAYEYPLEDLCLFKDFPHANQVWPIIVPGKVLECTCTLKWLQLYLHLYKPYIDSSLNYTLNYDGSFFQSYFLVNQKNWYEFCDKSFKCDFERLFNKCSFTNFEEPGRFVNFK